MRKQTIGAAAVIVVGIAVAVTVNLLTSGWNWLIFVVLGVLSGAWIALEIWRTVPRRAASLGTPVAGMAGTFVARPELTSRIVRALLAGRSRKVGITTALAGVGGFGKTTLAAQVCELPEIRKAFPARYWVTVGQEARGAALADLINDIVERVGKQRPGLTSPEQAGLELGEVLKEQGPSLLVVDDVWTAEQLRPFLNAGRGCTLLVTTRFPNLLTDHATVTPVTVDQMSRAQAHLLVTDGVPGLPEPVGEQLLELSGRWPIALSLANAALRRTVRDGGDVTTAAERLLHRLRDLGPAALDMRDTTRRERTVAATLESSLGLLGTRRGRVLELAIFPEDTEIPLDLVVLLWRVAAGQSEDDSELLCRDLAELSLITWRDDRLRLHDVVRTYLQHEYGTKRRRQLHDTLLNAVAATLPGRWWTLPPSAQYLWRTLAYHLDGAGRSEELAALATAPRWVIEKLRRFGPVAVAEDLAFVGTGDALELRRFLDQMGHLLVPGTPDHAVVNALAQRLRYYGLSDLLHAARMEAKRVPRLLPWEALPDFPDTALNRVLVGHQERAHACVFAPDGSWLATAASDGLRVWDPDTGQLLRLLPGRFWNLALSPDGHLACESTSQGLRVWDTSTWEPRQEFKAHRGKVTHCCYSVDSSTLASAGLDRRIRIWDSRTGTQLRSFKTPYTAWYCASMRDGCLLTVDARCVRIWDITTGDHTDLPLFSDHLPTDMAISPNGKWVVVAGFDGLVVHDLTRLDELPRVLRHHWDSTIAFSPNSETLATGSRQGPIVLWDTTEWRPVGHIATRGASVERLAFSPTRTVLASTGRDGTVRLWDPARARTDVIQEKVPSTYNTCATAPDGIWLATSGQGLLSVYDPETRQVQDEVRYSGDGTFLQNGMLLIQRNKDVFVCGPGDWRTLRPLLHPRGSRLHRVSGGGGLVCAVDDDHRVVVWDVETWRQAVFLELGESVRWADQLAIAPGGEWLAVSTDDVVHVVTPRTGNPITTLRAPAKVDRLASHGRLLAVHAGETIQYWHSETWTIHAEHTADRGTKDSAWSPDGALLATVSADRTLRVHDGHDWTTLTEIRLDGELNGCAWLSNDRLVAVGGHGVYWFTYVPG